MNIQERTIKIKKMAHELGFDQCRVAKAEFLNEEARHLEKWLKNGFHGQMDYMADNFDLRTDPKKLVPGAQSVICLSINYAPDLSTPLNNNLGEPKISKYAWGKDYHKVIKKKLKTLLAQITTEVGEIHGRGFVDSAPVLEKAWAMRSGIGWMGKHSNMITKEHGSFYFLAELIVDMDLEPDGAVTDHCGTCTACIDACPTQAIVGPQEVDGSKCISYLTIELKDQIPDEFKGKMADWVFGCDICQDVCPWNKFSKPHTDPAFDLREEILQHSREDWIEMTEDIFEKLIVNSPIRRTGLKGMKRNTSF